MWTLIFTTAVVVSGPEIRALDGLEKSIVYAQASEYARGQSKVADQDRRNYVKSRLEWNLREIGPDDLEWIDDLVDRTCKPFDAPKPVVVKAVPAPVLQEHPTKPVSAPTDPLPVAETPRPIETPSVVEQPVYYYVPQHYYIVPGCATGQCPR